MSKLISVVANQLAHRGFEVRRHPATRRQRLIESHRVDVVFDVGAARGGYATELRKFGYNGQIVSFEPLSAAYSDLVTASSADSSWLTVHTALGEIAGRADINVASNSDSSSLLPMVDAHRNAAPNVVYVASEQIDVTRLDGVAPGYLEPSSRPFLKLDTQGFERAVLAGGPDTLARCVGLQLELSFVPLYEGGMLADEALSFAYDHGFVLVGMEQGFADPGGALLQADGVFFRT